MNGSKPHIVIDDDRIITVPDELKEVAVQYDHNITTLIFDCPRYWDGHDLSKTTLCVNYIRPDGEKGARYVKNMVIDADNSSIIHFEWPIANHLTQKAGPVTFTVCSTGELDDDDSIHWSSRINKDLIIVQGLACPEVIQEEEEVYE